MTETKKNSLDLKNAHVTLEIHIGVNFPRFDVYLIHLSISEHKNYI